MVMIETTDHDGIAVLTLDNEPVNALDLELLAAIPEALAGVVHSRGVVLTGRGRSFSAGVDLKLIVDGGAAYVNEFLPALSLAMLNVFEYPKPIVAAVNGHALAGGCVLAAACDFRVMAGGTIGLTELAVGVPLPSVALEIMRHTVGPALDSMVLAAGRLTPDEAMQVGLVHEIVKPDQLLSNALQRVEGLCITPPGVFAASKQDLRAPARERILANRPLNDSLMLDIWSSEATRHIFQGYLQSLRRG
jgi:enoyl-CoA hydratase